MQCKELLTNKAYVFCVLALSVLFFVVGGIQYWASDYFIEVIGVPKADTHYYFGTTCITAPVFGAVMGAWAGSKLGGFRAKYTFMSCIMCVLVCVVLGYIMPSINTVRLLVLDIWLMLFFGAYCLPIATGVMLTTVPSDMRSQANSLANFSYNFLGYFPAPVIYGIICQYTGGKTSRWGMTFIMYSTSLAAIFIVMA